MYYKNLFKQFIFKTQIIQNLPNKNIHDTINTHNNPTKYILNINNLKMEPNLVFVCVV